MAQTTKSRLAHYNKLEAKAQTENQQGASHSLHSRQYIFKSATAGENGMPWTSSPQYMP